MASYNSDDGIDYPHPSRWTNWDTLSSEEKQSKINKSRNYLRYKMSKGWCIDTNNPNMTVEEKFIVEQYNANIYALRNLKIAFFTHFYDNCPKVGSTLKRKEKPKNNLADDVLGNLDIIK